MELEIYFHISSENQGKLLDFIRFLSDQDIFFIAVSAVVMILQPAFPACSVPSHSGLKNSIFQILQG